MAAFLAMDEFVRAATSGRRARAEALWRETDDPWARLVARRRLRRRPERARRAARLGAAALRHPLGVRERALARELLDARRRPERHLHQRVRRDVRALRRRRPRPRPRADARCCWRRARTPTTASPSTTRPRPSRPECLRALLEHGATAEPIMLAHALDDERPEHVRLLLDAGADAARAAARTPSAAAAGRRRSGCWSSAARTSSTAAARCGASPSGCAPPTSTRSCATATTVGRACWRSWARAPTSTSTTSRSPRSRAASARRSSRASSTATSRRR